MQHRLLHKKSVHLRSWRAGELQPHSCAPAQTSSIGTIIQASSTRTICVAGCFGFFGQLLSSNIPWPSGSTLWQDDNVELSEI
jgi:hypothetical protein